MNHRRITRIILILLLVLFASGAIYFVYSHRVASDKQFPVSQVDTQISSTSVETNEVPEPSLYEKNVTNQPAYLIAAYAKNEKNYVVVDYVEWLHGDVSIQAQVEDGECFSLDVCMDYPNGYKRNQNPKIRTLEVSPAVSITVNGSIAFTVDTLEQKNSGDPYGLDTKIEFETLVEALSKMGSYQQVKPSFKEPKTFITLDVAQNKVTKIVEPYQE